MSLDARLDAYLARRDLEAVWFAQPNSFAWLTGGSNVVSRDSSTGDAAAGYDGEGVVVVTNNIEAQRLRDEELAVDARIDEFAWYERDLADAVAEVSPTPAAADFDVPGLKSVAASELRQPLTDAQQDIYRILSEETATALEQVARETDPTDTERDVAADVRRELAARDIAAPVVLVGGADRAQTYRHYTPSGAPLGEYALLSVSASRDGLVTSCTRTVAFDPPDWLAERTRTAMRVEATALAATQQVGREGGAASEVFEAIQSAYEALGWDGEWQHHHQGGAAGFAGREWFATPDSDAPVVVPQGYAWNPTVQGAKSEDTHLVTADTIDPLSKTDDWPTTTVSAVGYDCDVERHRILER